MNTRDILGSTGFHRSCRGTWVLAFCMAVLALPAAGSTQQRPIDTARSTLTVRVYKTGLFSAFAHDHEITARVASGDVDTSAHRVELQMRAEALRIRDPDASEKDRAEIQQTMLGPAVLDSGRYPEITFRSTTAASDGAGSWTVHGQLSLHGLSRPVIVQVREDGGHYVGIVRLKQTDFGIKPVRLAGGAVRVKDEIRIEFDIQLSK